MAQSPLGIEQMVQQAIAGGARVIQYRDKTSSPAQQLDIARRLGQVCRQEGALFLINDDPQLAKQVAADGVHLGQTDSGLVAARALLGEDKIIGISCHASLDLALTAQRQGADYVAFGRFFDSRTKPQAQPAPIEILREASAALDIPIAAIGGISADNAPALLAAGADMLAVIHAVFGQTDIRQAAERITALFDPQGT